MIDDDFIDADFRIACKEIIENPAEINAKDFVQSYLQLKYR